MRRRRHSRKLLDFLAFIFTLYLKSILFDIVYGKREDGRGIAF